jgi:hypothetical protein
MNKKANSIIFLLVATLFNILLVAVLFIILIALYGFALQKIIPNAASWYLLASFIVSMVGAFFLYRIAIKIVTKRVNLEKYFDPLFMPRRK